MAATDLPDSLGLSEYVGREVRLVGRVSATPWQHLIGCFEGYPYDAYFDVGDDQIVVYSRTPLPETGDVRVRGTVVKVEGAGKGPRNAETYCEYHLTVEEWEAAG